MKQTHSKKKSSLLNITEITFGVTLGLILFLILVYLIVIYMYPDKFGQNISNENFNEFKDESLEDDIENLEDA